VPRPAPEPQFAKFRAVFDFANFVQAGEDPLANWPLLKPYTVHIHIKDALQGSGKVVPAGEGDGHIAAIIKDACATVTTIPQLRTALGRRGTILGLSAGPNFSGGGRSVAQTGARERHSVGVITRRLTLAEPLLSAREQ